MASLRSIRGLCLLELLVCIFCFSLLGEAIFQALRLQLNFVRQMKAEGEAEMSRAILKALIEESLHGASQFLPEPMLRIHRADKHVAGADLALTVADAYPEFIYQRIRNQNAPGIYCKYATSLSPIRESTSQLAIGIGVSAWTIVEFEEKDTNNRCRNGQQVELEIRRKQTPLSENDTDIETFEALLPLRDLYTLYRNDTSELKRFSYGTKEHQTVLRNLKEVRFERSESLPFLNVSFRVEKTDRVRRIRLPLYGLKRAHWLDFLW